MKPEGCLPDQVKIEVSNSIIKNVKSVVVPNTAGLKGIVGGRADKLLEVISEVTDQQKEEMKTFLEEIPVEVCAVDNGMIFDIIITIYYEGESAKVRICQYHTNIVYVEKNGSVLYDVNLQRQEGQEEAELPEEKKQKEAELSEERKGDV